MYNELLKIAVCPSCKTSLELTSFEKGNPPTAGAREAEVISGVLKCGCGILYPVIEGVPRFLEGGIKRFPTFINQFQRDLRSLVNTPELTTDSQPSPANDDYENIRKSFSQEWGAGIFDYENFNTWGWTLEERKKVVASELSMKAEELAGKQLLDAGCGNGTLSAALADLGLTVVGLDLNDGLGIAYKSRGKYSPRADAAVQYMQGNVVYPPLKESCFDVVYSSGVIHHTPDSRKAFETLARMTKPGGRLYIWVYGRRNIFVRLFFAWGRNLKNWMSLNSVLRVCRILAPFYKFAASALNATGFMKFRSRTVREVTLDLFDAFAPRFNHWHTEAELRSWFEELGFKNIHLTSKVRQGLGIYGDKC
ncbi:MAG: methyltransferase domain-containing protein [Verrucomicrobiota bacterium]